MSVSPRFSLPWARCEGCPAYLCTRKARGYSEQHAPACACGCVLARAVGGTCKPCWSSCPGDAEALAGRCGSGLVFACPVLSSHGGARLVSAGWCSPALREASCLAEFPAVSSHVSFLPVLTAATTCDGAGVSAAWLRHAVAVRQHRGQAGRSGRRRRLSLPLLPRTPAKAPASDIVTWGIARVLPCGLWL